MSYRFHITHLDHLSYIPQAHLQHKGKSIGMLVVVVVVVRTCSFCITLLYMVMMLTWNTKGGIHCKWWFWIRRGSRQVFCTHNHLRMTMIKISQIRLHCLLISVTPLIPLLCNAFTSRIYRYLLCKRVVHPLLRLSWWGWCNYWYQEHIRLLMWICGVGVRESMNKVQRV